LREREPPIRQQGTIGAESILALWLSWLGEAYPFLDRPADASRMTSRLSPVMSWSASGATYLLCLSSVGWRIAVLALHASVTVVRR
jgi:hypothetical protein